MPSSVPEAFVAAMNDDLGTPTAVAVLQGAVRDGNLDDARARGTVSVVEGDVRDADAVRSAASGVDGVFHLAVLPLGPSIADPALAHEVNVGGSLNVFLDLPHNVGLITNLHVIVNQDALRAASSPTSPAEE